ncbi:MAG: hypothetical protein EA405_13395 [Rhodospirillales bacterium]|nr:MAG: hypothetical protein EA405_13395 [Rhodospirillales bacterium]
MATPAFGQGRALQGGPASLDQLGEGRGILLIGEEVVLLEDGGPKHGKIVVIAKQAAHVIRLITARRR